MKSRLRFMLDQDWHRLMGRRLGIWQEHQDGTTAFAQPLQFKVAVPGEEMPPALFFEEQEVIDLMDALWRAGIRPTRRAQEEKAELEAVRDHLRDMRQIAFSATKVVPPEYSGPFIVKESGA